ncbi:hypothetical protein BD779DRAFT_1437947, partial [Infundibulicybe gibba]
DLDLATSLLIARLALDDIRELELGRKGKGRADVARSDEEYAFALQADSIQDMMLSFEDFKIARSISNALATDQVYLDVAAVSEQGAADDHAAALALQQGAALPEPTAAQKLLEVLATSVPSETTPSTSRPDGGDLGGRSAESGSSSRAPHNSHASGRVDCVSCGDRPRSVSSLSAPCGHFYCPDCVNNLVVASTRDESLFPLRCCREPIPMNLVQTFLSAKQLTLFLAKSREFGTLASNRIYCPSPQCSKFLGSSRLIFRTDITCSCGTSVCTQCKQRSHPGDTCTENTAAGEVRLGALAKANGWQTCPQCHAVIELQQGCYHMTCRCRAEFCYLCAALWKTCECIQWEEARLINAAEQRVENEFGARARQAPAVFEQRVNQRATELRQNHDCDRHRWRRRNGGGPCGECHFHLPDYLLLCQGCGILACVRCARNRL